MVLPNEPIKVQPVGRYRIIRAADGVLAGHRKDTFSAGVIAVEASPPFPPPPTSFFHPNHRAPQWVHLETVARIAPFRMCSSQ